MIGPRAVLKAEREDPSFNHDSFRVVFGHRCQGSGRTARGRIQRVGVVEW